MPLRPLILPILASGLSFLFLIFAFPLGGLSWLIFLFLPPFLLLYRLRTGPCVLLVAVIFICSASYVSKAWWIVPTITQALGGSYALASSLISLLGVVAALPYVIGFLILKQNEASESRYFAIRFSLIFAFAAAVVPSVFLVTPGHALHDVDILRGVVRFGGLEILNFLVALVGVLIFEIMTARSFAKRFAFIFGLVIVSVTWIGLGNWQIADAIETEAEQSSRPAKLHIRVAAVQPNVPHRRITYRNSASRRHYRSEVMQQISNAFDEPNVDMIILPEIPGLTNLLRNIEMRNFIFRRVGETGRPILLTSHREIDEIGSNDRWFVTSSAVLVTAPNLTQVSDKSVLIPFGEFLPFERTWPKLRDWMPSAGILVPGKKFRSFDLNGHRLAMLLCYDDLFPKIAMRRMADRPDLFITLTNENDFVNSDASKFHILLAKFRALETGIPLLRISNSGENLMFDPFARHILSVISPPNTSHRRSSNE